MSIDKTAHPLPLDAPEGSGLWLVPFPIYAAEIKLLLERKYDVDLLYDGYNKLIEALELDVLLVDTVSGLDEETLLSIATSDVLIEVLRPNQRDYHGTSVTIDVAKKLDITD